MLFCVFFYDIVQSQVEDFHTNGKFAFIDTIKIDSQYLVNPGQLSKDGSIFYTGLYYDDDNDSTYSNIYAIDIKKNNGEMKNLHIPLPEGYQEFFQCSASADNNILVFVVNHFGGWGANDLAISTKNADGTFSKASLISELNSIDTADAFPWLSSDGLRIYFVKNDYLMYSERTSPTSAFKHPVPLNFDGNVLTPARSCWLSADEKTLFYTSKNIIYKATRKKTKKPFSLPKVFSTEFKDFDYIAGISFAPDLKNMYIYFSGEEYLILHYKLK